jgi:hypothetical protein
LLACGAWWASKRNTNDHTGAGIVLASFLRMKAKKFQKPLAKWKRMWYNRRVYDVSMRHRRRVNVIGMKSGG